MFFKRLNRKSLFCFRFTLITHSMIPLITWISLLWSTEASHILSDYFYWLLIFLWNIHFLLSSIYFSKAVYTRFTIILGSLGLLIWLINMIFIAIIALTSPVYEKIYAYILSCIPASIIMVILGFFLINRKFRGEGGKYTASR